MLSHRVGLVEISDIIVVVRELLTVTCNIAVTRAQSELRSMFKKEYKI